MAVDTMLKIAQKCKRRFVQVQHGESRAFIDELCGTLPAIISDLEPHQVSHSVTGAVDFLHLLLQGSRCQRACVRSLLCGPFFQLRIGATSSCHHQRQHFIDAASSCDPIALLPTCAAPCVCLPFHIHHLQVTVFYEAAGHMVNAYADERSREVSTASLMDLPNKMWRRLMGLAGESIENLKHPDTLRELQRVLRTNVAACRSIGSSFASQVS